MKAAGKPRSRPWLFSLRRPKLKIDDDASAEDLLLAELLFHSLDESCIAQDLLRDLHFQASPDLSLQAIL
jgi:hypothetical protein